MTPVALDPKLTETRWNSEKSIIAKLKTKTNETGITAALKALATAHHAIEWNDIAAVDNPGSYPSEAAVREQAVKVVAAVAKIRSAITAVKAVHKQASDAYPLFKNSKIIPSKSTAFINTLMGESDLLEADYEEAIKVAEGVEKTLVKVAKAKAQGF